MTAGGDVHDWGPLVGELARRKARALGMGGSDLVERQHSLGKLTVRERLELLVDPGTWVEYGLLADLFRSMYGLGKPTIARVRGYALAGGFGLACACDLLIAADDAVFGTPEIDVGLWPYMITVPLLRSLPPKRVLELMMTGRRVDAVEAERLGFVTRVVPVAELDAAVDELAATLAAKSPLIIRWGRDAFYRVLEQPDSDAALAYLQTMLSVTSHTEDAAEGVAAFAQKRAPEWRGR